MLPSRTLFACLLAGAGLAAAALPAAEEKRRTYLPRAVVIDVSKDFIDFRRDKDLRARYHIAPPVAKPSFWPLTNPAATPTPRPRPIVCESPAANTGRDHQNPPWM